MAGPTLRGAGSPVAALRSPMLAQLMPELDRIEPRTRVAVSGLPESGFLEQPPEGGWSIAQVFEHFITDDLVEFPGLG